jgi:hypothetical protein
MKFEHHRCRLRSVPAAVRELDRWAAPIHELEESQFGKSSPHGSEL